jgi:hypothetical protein
MSWLRSGKALGDGGAQRAHRLDIVTVSGARMMLRSHDQDRLRRPR